MVRTVGGRIVEQFWFDAKEPLSLLQLYLFHRQILILTSKEHALATLVEHLYSPYHVMCPYLYLGDYAVGRNNPHFYEFSILAMGRLCPDYSVLSRKLQICWVVVAYMVYRCDWVLEVDLSWVRIVITSSRATGFDYNFSGVGLELLEYSWCLRAAD